MRARSLISQMLDLLAGGDATVVQLAERIGAGSNSCFKAIDNARRAALVHIVGYARAGGVYRLGAGVDALRHRPTADTEKAVPLAPLDYPGIEYFEYEEMPGKRQFFCSALRSTLSVLSCAEKHRVAVNSDVGDRHFACLRCPVGASHSGRSNPNTSPLRGMTICGRCHRGATRLVGKHLCVSCQNRQYESLKGKNAKGTKPVKLPDLDQRSITYRAAGAVKTRTIALSVGTDELVMAVLRDEKNAMQFGFRNVAMHALFDGEDFDRSMGEDESQNALEVAEAVAGLAEVAELVASEAPTMPADPYAGLRELVDDAHEVPACAPVMSRRAAKRARQKVLPQVRVSSVTVNLLRGIGALPRPVPVLAPVAMPGYSASLMSGGSALG
jgi:hypothetical protein